MAKLNQNSRRMFLVSGALSLQALAICRKFWILGPQQSPFITEYTIDISSKQLDSGLKADDVFGEIVRIIINAKALSPSWIENHDLVKQRYLKQGLLVDYKRFLSDDGKSFTCVDLWKDQEALISFIKESQLHLLDEAYAAVGFRPLLANSERIFPKARKNDSLLKKLQKTV